MGYLLLLWRLHLNPFGGIIMLLRGDLNRLMEDVNRVLDGAFQRIQVLEDKVQALENPGKSGTVAAVEPSRRRGRPPGSKNKTTEAA
jgi:hypothetical protein